MEIITSIYEWNESRAPWNEWDEDLGGFKCANAENSGITFKLKSGNTALNANAATIEKVTWTASVGTASGIARNKYYFTNFCVKKNGEWSSNIGNTNISNWKVGTSTGTIDRASAFDIPDGTVSLPNTFKGLGGSELKCRISIGNKTT